MPGHEAIEKRPQSPPRRRRACLPCTKAKARCHYENNESTNACTRCQRLKLGCNPQTTRIIRRPRQIKSHSIEGNFDLVPIGEQACRQTTVSESGAIDTSATADDSQSHDSSPPHINLLALRDLSDGPGFGINWDQAEEAVQNFSLLVISQFPFVILDHDITARRLSLKKPLLFRAILMIGLDLTVTKSREIQKSIDAWIGHYLLAMEEQTLGALQGLLVYIIWATSDFFVDHRVTQLIYLAVGVAHSLGITRQPFQKPQVKQEAELNEEYRAFLACYYVVSFNAFQFSRGNPLSSSHVQYCVDSLETSSEFPTDFLLVKLVKFRQILERVPRIYGSFEGKWYREISEDASEQLDRIRKELDELMSDVAYKHPKFLLLRSLYHSAFIQLQLPMTYAVPDSEKAERLQLDCLQRCLQASRKYVDLVKSLSPDSFLYAAFTRLVDTISMLIAASRLSMVEIDGWDLQDVRQSLNLKIAVDELLKKYRIGAQVKAAKIATAATGYPSSFIADGDDEEKKGRFHAFVDLIESIRIWLDDYDNLVLSETELEHAGHGEIATTKTTTMDCVHFGPQSPQWDFTYFIQALLKVG
ncbi:hypothetical protein F4808DRAFT_423155 [Astrocystis sublimbata]|nr:hypothetical protein F4808DRAFT_423155 [Astrocystis sublimbata]